MLARAARIDSLTFRCNNIGDPRWLGVLNAAAAAAGLRTRGQKRGCGAATCHRLAEVTALITGCSAADQRVRSVRFGALRSPSETNRTGATIRVQQRAIGC
jgi:hypothetical protein